MRYRLETQHSIWDMLLDEGTEIGDGTRYPIPDDFVPSAAMIPLDDAAKERVREISAGRLNWGRPEDNIPIVPLEAKIYGPSVIRQPQPTIPPLIEQLTHPNTLKPGDSPIDLAEAIAAENDKKMAVMANENARALADAFPKPAGVSEGQGPAPKPVEAPGQGPAKRSK